MYNYNVYTAMRQLGVTQLRTKQSKVLSCILQNRDVLVRLCTGGGKSLLFQLPALLDEPGQLTLVFSPLLALQEDQVSALKKKGVRAALLNSNLSKRRHAATLRDFVQNGGLLYLAPEQLRREDVRTALSTARVRRVVVDEVHILPQVDRGFRPAYAEIGAFIKSLRIPPQILAFTATATASDFSYIARSLHMVEPKRFLFSVKRSNIKISIKEFNVHGKDNVKRRKRTQRLKMLDAVLRQHRPRNGATIVYCPTVNDVKRTTKYLRGEKYSAKAYYSELPKGRKSVCTGISSRKSVRSSLRRTHSVSASTGRTSGSSCTPVCRSASMPTHRKSVERAATAKRRAPFCFTPRRTLPTPAVSFVRTTMTQPTIAAKSALTRSKRSSPSRKRHGRASRSTSVERINRASR